VASTGRRDERKKMAAVVSIRDKLHAREREVELTRAVGMAAALAAWAMMFGALLFAYVWLRAQALAWPPPGLGRLPRALPGASTAAIAASSAAVVAALGALRRGERRGGARWLGLAVALGVTFLALQMVLWRGLWLDGVRPSTGALGAVVYALTALHWVHALAGLVALGWLLSLALRSRSPGGWALERRATTLRVAGMFWHFVGAVWVVMFVGVFVL
jgi:heme/copper-type cytochrome/quinol oxidase subunit 3